MRLDECFSKLKVWETDNEEALKIVSEQTTEGSFTMYKQFETETVEGIVRFFAEFRFKTNKISGGLKSFLSESISEVQREIAIHVARPSYWLAIVSENISVKGSASVSVGSTEAAGIVLSTSTG